MSTVTTYNNAECFITLTSETAFTVPSYNSRNNITFKNASAAACTLTAFGTETIDGASTYALPGYSSVKMVRGDSGWVIVGGYDALSGDFAITNDTDASLAGAGSITTAGGIYATKKLVTGLTTDSTSTTTGALLVAGGAGIAKAVFMGTTANVAGVVNADATTEATTGGAGSVVCDGGIYAAKRIITNTSFVSTGAAITSGSGTGLTVNETAIMRRVIHKVTVDYTAFAAAATTGDKAICVLPAKTRLLGIYGDVTTKFVGGAITAATLGLGISAGGVEVLAASDVFTAAVTLGLTDAQLGTAMTRAAAIQGGYVPSFTATTTLTARITTTTANTNALTQGSVTFYLITEVLP